MGDILQYTRIKKKMVVCFFSRLYCGGEASDELGAKIIYRYFKLSMEGGDVTRGIRFVPRPLSGLNEASWQACLL